MLTHSYRIFLTLFLLFSITSAQYDNNYGGGYDNLENSGSVAIGEFFLELIP